MKVTTSFEDVVANRGEDLRFPISSSSGFSSPFTFYPSLDIEGPCRIAAGIFFFVFSKHSIHLEEQTTYKKLTQKESALYIPIL
jgi:hypothetical protein